MAMLNRIDKIKSRLLSLRNTITDFNTDGYLEDEPYDELLQCLDDVDSDLDVVIELASKLLDEVRSALNNVANFL